jgi:hypothetical protein
MPGYPWPSVLPLQQPKNELLFRDALINLILPSNPEYQPLTVKGRNAAA